jgi:penicillin-binding protein 1A
MMVRRIFASLLALLFTGVIAVAALAAFVYVKVEPKLPAIEVLKEVQLQEPLRIYTRDRRLIAEFGDKRRTPVQVAEVPADMINAFLAAEDDHFYEHSGVDIPGLLSAAFELVRTGKKRRGASTITMQVARNFFLSSEKTYWRKITEILLALRIEGSLSKDEILELYLNKIYLGHHAYGIEAAAQVYYGKHIDELTLAQMATIAALPKAPSRINPINSPKDTMDRRNYILGRMHQLGYIEQDAWELAVAEPNDAERHKVQAEVDAAYVAEMVRHELVKRYGTSIYTSGYQAITTLDVASQAAANAAVHKDLLGYSRRHGYRGAEAHVNLAEHEASTWPTLLEDYPIFGGLQAGLVVGLDEQSAEILTAKQSTLQLGWEGLSWARPYLGVNRLGKSPKQAADVLKVGDVVRLRQQDDGSWMLEQLPRVQGALVSLRPTDGAVQALVGGFDFRRSKFNRAMQAKRQPGSSFKPVIYSAALEKGFTPASMINDAPVVFDDPKLESTWRPENYSGEFFGPTRLREALYRSRNLVSIRILRAIGASYAAEYAERFGFVAAELPKDLTLALGSATVTPMQMARAYAVLANGGYLIEPYFIHAVYDASGKEIFAAKPAIACPQCPPVMESINTLEEEPVKLASQVLTPQNVWLMTSMMRDVIQRGTGRKARVLGRTDLAGKTGTTNDQKDAWFSGFNHALVTTAWVGFDKLEPLGRGETGGRAALPIWIDYMAVALKGIREQKLEPPEGLVSVRIDPATGLLAGSGQADAIFETFREANVPSMGSGSLATGGAAGAAETAEDQLF